jgi:hypothetical protein
MDGENTTTQTAQTVDSTTQAATAATGDTATQTPAVIETPKTPAPVVIPDGYVPATEVESERTARTAAETARAEAETRATAAEARARATEIKAAAQALGFNDPSDAERFIAADATDIEAALKEVLAQKSYLGKPAESAAPVVTPTSPTNPARTATALPVFTQAQIGDRTFWASNKDAIMLAMREGRISA